MKRLTRVAWRDSMMTWPFLSVTLLLLPWHWRLVPYGYYDYTPGYKGDSYNDARAGWWGIDGEWLMVKATFGFNLPPFTFERVEKIQ